MQEAIKRTTIEEDMRLGQKSSDVHVDLGDEESRYKQEVLGLGRSILKEARIPELLGELEKILKPEFPDLMAILIQERATASGALSLEFTWDFQSIASTASSPYKYEFKNVSVCAYPLTGNLVVYGGEGGKVLTNDEWRSNPELVADAIARAYLNPSRIFGPPVRA